MNRLDRLEVTPHVVRFRGAIYQISNICSASAYKYTVTFKDVWMVVFPLLGGFALGGFIGFGYLFVFFGLVNLIRLAILTSKHSLRIEMSSGAADLFQSENYGFLVRVVSTIENFMASKNGPIHMFNIRTGSGDVYYANNIGSVNNSGSIGSVGNVGDASEYSYHGYPGFQTPPSADPSTQGNSYAQYPGHS